MIRRQATRARMIRRGAALAVPAVAAALLAVTLPDAAAATTLTVKAGADSYVRADQPDANFGTKYVLDAQAATDGSPLQLSYVRFDVTGLTHPLASATLKLYTYSTATEGLQVWSSPSNWTESGITYTNAPVPNKVMVGAIPTIKTDTWAQLDVSNVVTGNGTYTFVVTTTATANKTMASRESTTSTPQLVLGVAGDPSTITASAGSGQSAATGANFATALAATVTDSGGAGVASVPVTFTAPSSGASGAFAGGSAAVSISTDANGVATAPAFTANATAGSYSVTAAATGVTNSASFALTNSGTDPTSSPPVPSTTPPADSSSASPSGSPSSSPPPVTQTRTFALAADTYVRSDQPDANFGTKYNLANEAGSASTPTITSYVSVQVKNLTDPIVSSTLQLYSYATSSLGIKVWNTVGGWTETGITYNNAPAIGTAAGSGPNIMLNTWASVDLGSSITGNGTYNFAITTTRTANNQFGSRESGYAPKVVVTTAASSTSTPPPSTSPPPSTTTPPPTTTAPPGSTPPPSTTVPPSTTPAGQPVVMATGGAVQSTMVTTTFASTLMASVTVDGTPSPGTAVTFTAPADGPSATFPGGAATVTVTTDSTGVATSPPVTANATAGTYPVSASVAGAAQSAVFTLSNTDPTIVAAGDIACTATDSPSASACQQVATSNLAIGLSPNYVLPLGDDQYELGSLSDYQKMYDPSWGRLNSIAYPVPGNHEYGYIGSSVQPTGGTGYFTYFGDRSHPLQPGCTSLCTSWYSYNIGSWHVIALDSQCAVIGGCNPGNAEYNWLQADLKANPATCTLAYWHIPVFSSSQDHQPDMQAMYSLLASKKADVVLTGHAHFYERFDPQDASGNPVATAPREFIVGSGGRNFFPIRQTPSANSVSRIANTFGVLQMTLSKNSYSWQFVAANGGTATDSGSATCS